MSGQHQVDNEDPLLNESELDDGEASVLPASRSSQAAPTVTTGGVVGTTLQQFGRTFDWSVFYVFLVPVHKIDK
jgi:hypothetical protein